MLIGNSRQRAAMDRAPEPVEQAFYRLALSLSDTGVITSIS
jgi:hypothetical protein